VGALNVEKACAVPFRLAPGELQVLAFRHPLAGHQFVKGSIEPGETPEAAAVRELAEECGLVLPDSPEFLATRPIGEARAIWEFFAFPTNGLAERWDHHTEDGGGLIFSFFWHPLDESPDDRWHPIFHDAWRVIAETLPAVAAGMH